MSKDILFQDTEKDRSRVWAFEVYPSSADPEWLNYLAESLIHSYISPLHDQDIDPDGNKKTPHYHVMLMYDTVQFPHQVIKDIIDIVGGAFGGCNILENYDEHKLVEVIPVKGSKRRKWQGISNFSKSFGVVLKISSKSGMARYLCHLDNADKHQYDPEDVIVFGKQDYYDVIGNSFDRYEMLQEMREYCRKNNIIYYSDLYDYAAEYRPSDWFRVLSDNGTYVMDRYIKALNFKHKEFLKRVEMEKRGL